MNIKGAIFDLDGTLLDSMLVWESIGSLYLTSLGIVPEEGLDAQIRYMSMFQAAGYLRERFAIRESVGDIINGVSGMMAHYYANVVPAKPDVDMLLEKLRSRGVKMCVATATDRYLAESALSRTGLDKYFCCILTCSEAGSGKDCPDIYEKALQRLQTGRDETLVFEDALHAIKTAKKAGFPVAAVYDKSSRDEQAQARELCDLYIASYKDLSETI